MSRRTWAVIGVLAALTVTAVFYFRPRSDAELSADMVGQWVATDLGNASLHKHEEGVEREEIEIQGDGTLTYHVKLKTGSASEPSATSTPASTRPALALNMQNGSSWGWRVAKGRLQIKDLGPDSTQEWMPPLKFSVSRNTLTLRRRNFDAKEFKRLTR